jgi:hypothetical protein
MSDQTRKALRQLGEDMRVAAERTGGIGGAQPEVTPAPGVTPPLGKPSAVPGRRADPRATDRIFEPASASAPGPARRQ